MFTTLPGTPLTYFSGLMAFNPATLFSSGQPGAWYDPSDYATLSQDSAGTTPVNASAQPVGLMFDKRLGSVLGPELVTNGTFDSSLTGWTQDLATWAATGGKAVFSGADFQSLRQVISGYAGSFKVITFDLTITSGSLIFRPNNASTTDQQTYTTSGTKTLRVTPSVSTIELFTTGSATGVTIDNVSVKLLAGNHISQATAAARSITGAAGAVLYETFDGVDDGMATGAMTFSADMDCFIAIRRNSVAALVLAFPVANASSNFFGVAASADAAAADSGAGTPTYAVNGVSLNGGLTGTTRGQLHTALPVGSWVILEIRNLNLSALAWNAFGFGNYGTGFNLNGDFGGMILCPAGDAAQRQKNRQYLGNKVGLTLT